MTAADRPAYPARRGRADRVRELIRQTKAMPGVEQAAERLSAAVARLEQAIEARQQSSNGEAEALRAALSESQVQTAALKEATETVSGRLDAAIERLKGVLED